MGCNNQFQIFKAWKSYLIVIGTGALLSLSGVAQAGPFVINVDCAGSTACEQAFQRMQDDVNNDLPDADQSTYLKGMSNASVFSVKGNGTDYANDIDLFIFGVGIGAGLDVGDNSFGDLVSGDVDGNQIRGVSIAPSLMLGVNMGIFNLPKWGSFDPNQVKLMANFFTMNLGSFGDDLDGKVTNFGLHARYKVVGPKDFVPRRMVRWTGVDVTTGLEYNSLELKYTQTFQETYADDSNTFEAEIDGTVVAGADVSTTSIPLTVSTGMQLGYVLSLYTGLGLDLNLGSATSLANVDAVIRQSGGPIEGTGTLDLGDKDGPSTFLTRGFIGLQFNFPIVKIYTQLDRSFNEDLYAVNAGLRFTW